jgi:UDP-N-acetylmuramate: L-alanyl-gamma-D-glutamyl-meso-diaminopimelate ligase
MPPLPPDARIHLIAACGTAMGSLAGMLAASGYRGSGSDAQIYPPMSTFLQKEGLELYAGFDAAHLDPSPDLVVIGNAVSRGNPEVEATLDRRLPYASLPEVLRDLFLRDKRPIVVAGTHGKTTTTAMTAHLLHQTAQDPSFLIAGLPRDFDRPFRLGNGPFFVVEGDEYDSAFFAKYAKFFHYLPEILVLNAIEFDHADIYADLEEIKKTFRQLINIVPANGLIIANGDDPVLAELLPAAFAPVQTFGLGPDNYWRADCLSSDPQGQVFGLWRQDEDLGEFELKLSGAYNVRNALAALAAAHAADVDHDALRRPLATFSGVHRRQEHLGTADGIDLIDDFAHHPTAVGQALEGLRQAHPQRRLWAVFEPASATNARAFFEERYLAAFAVADRVTIGRVPRPERARLDPPFSPQRLATRLNQQGVYAEAFDNNDQVLASLETNTQAGDLVVFMSNGGFGGVQLRLLAALERRHAQS